MRTQALVRRGAVVVVLALACSLVFAGAASASMASDRHPAGSRPKPPKDVTLATGNGSLGAAWLDSSAGRLTFTATATASSQPTESCTTRVFACVIPSLANGVLYTVTVVATNRSGSSAPSKAVTAIVGVPGPPRQVRAIPGKAAATISWAPPRSSGASKITGYVATANPGGFSCSTESNLLTNAARTCQISGLESHTQYTVTVSATNVYGTGQPSKPVMVTPS